MFSRSQIAKLRLFHCIQQWVQNFNGPKWFRFIFSWKPQHLREREREWMKLRTIFWSLELHHIKLYCIRSIFCPILLHPHILLFLSFSFLFMAFQQTHTQKMFSVALNYDIFTYKNNLQKQYSSVCVSMCGTLRCMKKCVLVQIRLLCNI